MSRLIVSLRACRLFRCMRSEYKSNEIRQIRSSHIHSFISVFPPSVGLDDVIFDAEQQQKQRTTKRMDQNRLSDSAWMETLAWLGRAEVGMKLALVNTRFNMLVDKQFMLRQWRFGEFHICEREGRGVRRGGAEIITSEDGTNFITLPLPTTPMPCSVVGFQSLSIWFINADVIKFLRRIRRLFAEDIALEFSTRHTEFRSWTVIARHIWPLLRDGISTLVCLRKSDLAMLRKHVSPTVLFDCPDLHRIHTDMVPECPSDAADAENTDPTCRELYAWIHAPRDDRQAPISLKLSKWRDGKWEQFVDNLFKSFGEAPYPVTYIIQSTLPFRFTKSSNPENVVTGERLTMEFYDRTQNGVVETEVMITRSETNCDGAKLKNLLESRIGRTVPDNLVHIAFNDNEIGQLPSSSADAESASRTRTTRSA
ncbi:hypothetical protein niasHS_014039 [Heterodera schachtii]|uniref:F-box domain-containing protein n=1 Tax=Heterodera schachtii TaxID=97005 RepID=A0ABD2INV9_HETSC